MDLRTSGTVYYKNDAANNRFIVEYKDVPHYDPPAGGPYTYQVILYSDGRIYYQYLSMTSTLDNATIGNENTGGATGLQVVFNAAYMHNNLAIKIEKGLTWVDETPSSGTIVPGGNQNVSVAFNSTGLSIGAYSGILKLSSNDPLRPVKNIPVKLNVGPVGIQSSDPGIPTEFDLKQNYPNPFNPTTKLEFGISDLGFVSLKVYDLLGKEVKTLVSENLNPGRYKIEFDGSSLASGIYFYTLETKGFSETKRMILLK